MMSDKEAAKLEKMIEELKKKQVIDTQVSVEEARQILNDKYGVPSEDRGPLDLTLQIEKLKKKVMDVECEMSLIKAVGINSPEMRAAKQEIQELKKDNKILAHEIGMLHEKK
jgi:cell division protein FtsB|tara:strand:+ start:1587 stop:1922 length:336 start_codon:yes stop_codon:yes gene_type:complete